MKRVSSPAASEPRFQPDFDTAIGHMSKDCPTRGPMICTNCAQEGKCRFRNTETSAVLTCPLPTRAHPCKV